MGELFLTPSMHPSKDYMSDIAAVGRYNAYGNFLDRFRGARNQKKTTVSDNRAARSGRQVSH